MKITNSYNVPAPLVTLASKEYYSKGASQYSVTELMSPPKVKRLREQYDKEIVQDVSDMLWSMLGSALHVVMERGDTEGWTMEERLFHEVDGVTISGAIDLQHDTEGGGTPYLFVMINFLSKVFMMKHYDSAIVDELQVLSLFILGEPASKANSRRVVKFGNMSRLIKSQKALNYSDTFRLQCPPLAKLMTGDLRVSMRIYYATRRPDLDESLILDLMQGLVYENDRQVKERHTYWGLDAENPRSEIIIEQIPEVVAKKKPRTKRG